MILIGFLIVFNSAPKLSRNGFTIQTFWQKNHSELAQHVGTPLTELRGTDGIDPITHGDNGIEVVELRLVSLAILSSMCKFCTYLLHRQFIRIKDVLQMFGYHTSVHVEQRRHRLLRGPNRLILVEHLYALLLACSHKGQELCRAVAYLKFLCHRDVVLLSFSFPIPLQSGQALHDALRFEAHLDHGEQQVEDVARRVNEKSDRPSQGSRLNKTLNYDLNQALAINISHNAI